jgi:predicted DNA-binding transcriptional regulator YafY
VNRLAGITAIVLWLQSKKITSAKEIAEQFEISLRTVCSGSSSIPDAGVLIGSECGVGYHSFKLGIHDQK